MKETENVGEHSRKARKETWHPGGQPERVESPARLSTVPRAPPQQWQQEGTWPHRAGSRKAWCGPELPRQRRKTGLHSTQDTHCHTRRVCRGLPEKQHHASSCRLQSHEPEETWSMRHLLPQPLSSWAYILLRACVNHLPHSPCSHANPALQARQRRPRGSGNLSQITQLLTQLVLLFS